MNYYTDSQNGYSMNNQNYDHYFNNQCFYGDFSNNSKENCACNFNRNNYDYGKKHSCCVRSVEETFCCFPSYYKDEEEEDKKDKCFEGTFKICPKQYDRIEKNICCNNKEFNGNNCKKQHNCNHHSQYNCGLCCLFRNCQ